ncbi:hypothetical protein CBR_g45714 [Chara braunii]|uniref:Telomerase reverse transcriptase n=1 Tax=Chara braunii TaxID=69332 RepID=A0A388K3S8_CHABU|nr:hypothetical protein CBR_g45714 [Chara braunii]|eukprot:GBG64659.1 hypothetical protein CBR_g45714 [Chara braunii]
MESEWGRVAEGSERAPKRSGWDRAVWEGKEWARVGSESGGVGAGTEGIGWSQSWNGKRARGGWSEVRMGSGGVGWGGLGSEWEQGGSGVGSGWERKRDRYGIGAGTGSEQERDRSRNGSGVRSERTLKGIGLGVERDLGGDGTGDGTGSGWERDLDGDGKGSGWERDRDGDGKGSGWERDLDGDGTGWERDRDGVGSGWSGREIRTDCGGRGVKWTIKRGSDRIMIGSEHNWGVLRRNVVEFVRLHRWESMTLSHAIRGFRLSDVKGLMSHSCSHPKTAIKGKNIIGRNKGRGQEASGNPRRASFSVKRQRLMEDWIYFLFASVVIPLIRAHFYVTESEGATHRVCYFRKPVWDMLTRLWVENMTAAAPAMPLHAVNHHGNNNDVNDSNCMYTKLSRFQVCALLRRKERLAVGFSAARLVPKGLGTRAIVNSGKAMSKVFHLHKKRDVGSSKMFGRGGCSKSTTRGGGNWEREVVPLRFQPVNSVLRDAHHCLKFEQSQHGDETSGSVFGYNDAYAKLRRFVTGLKTRPGGFPSSLYIAVCDMANAFDNIDQEKMRKITAGFIREEHFKVQR